MNTRRLWYTGTFCVFLVILLYLPGLADFFLFDSKANLLENAALQQDFTQFSHWLAVAGSSDSGPSGRPLAMLSFATHSAWLGELSASSIKAGNLFIHLLTGLALYRAVLLLLPHLLPPATSETRTRALALTAVLLWLLHPLQVSTVLYAIQRMQQLSSLFVVLGLIVFMQYRTLWLQRVPSGLEISRCCLLVLLCLLAAFFCKENGVILLPLLLVIEVAVFQCVVAGAPVKALRFGIGALVLTALLVFIGFILFPPEWLLFSYAERDFDLGQRLLTQARVLWQYLNWFFLLDVRDMALHHDDIRVSTSWLDPITTLISALAWLVVIVLACAALVFDRRLFFLVPAWFLICHSVESTLLPLEQVYEHRNYLALFGPCLLVAAGLWLIGGADNYAQRWILTSLILLLVSGLLLSRTNVWRSEEQFSAYHLHRHPLSVRSNYHYANTQLRLAEASAKPDEAQAKLLLSREYYLNVLNLSPGSFTALVSLLYLDERYFSSYESARWLDEINSELLSNQRMLREDAWALALLLRCQLEGYCNIDPQELEQTFARAAEVGQADPIYADLWAVYLGLGLGELKQAREIHLNLSQRFPDYDAAHIGLATWYQQEGREGEAQEAIRSMLGRAPNALRAQQVFDIFAEEEQ